MYAAVDKTLLKRNKINVAALENDDTNEKGIF